MNSSSTKSLWFTGLVAAFLLVNCDGGPTSSDGGGGPGFAEAPFNIDVTVAGQTRLRVDGINGSVDVAGSTSANSVLITGVRRVRSEQGAHDAGEQLAQVEVRVIEQDNVILVRTIQPEATGGLEFNVNYVITVPQNLGITVDNINGAVSVDGINERVAVSNVNGAIDLMSIVGSTTADVVNGQIVAQITLPRNGTLDMETVNGTIDLQILQNTSAQFSASVSNGDIALTNLTLQGAVSTPNSLQGTLGDGTGTIILRTVNGGIDVTGI